MDEENLEPIFVRVEYANEDVAMVYVGVNSDSEPVISNIWNSHAWHIKKIIMKGHFSVSTTYALQPVSHPVATSSGSQPESGSAVYTWF